MPGDGVQERPFWQQWLHIVLVVVDNVPTKVPRSATNCLSAAVWQDRLDTLALAAVVQMWLESGQTDVRLERMVTIVPHLIVARRNVDVEVLRKGFRE